MGTVSVVEQENQHFEEPNERAVIVAAVQGVNPELAAFIQIAKDPNIAFDKFKDLMTMYREMDMQRRKDAFTAAMMAVQYETQPIVVDAENKQTNSLYATLENVSNNINPVIKRHGFTMSFGSKEPATPGNICVTCRVRHSAGHTEDYQLEGPPDDKGLKGAPNKTGIQGLISSSSYLRRVLKLMIWDITVTGLDRDGNNSSVVEKQEAENITNMVNACGLSPERVKKLLAFAHAESVATIPRYRYNEIMQYLRRVLTEKQEKGA